MFGKPINQNPRKQDGKVSQRKKKLICRASSKSSWRSLQLERAYNVRISLEVQN